MVDEAGFVPANTLKVLVPFDKANRGPLSCLTASITSSRSYARA